MHIPDDPLYYEKFYFTPGDLGFRAFDTRVRRGSARWSAGTSGIPEAARLTALQGAEVLFYPTAIGWHPPEKAEYGAAQRDAWQTIQRAHAIANGVYVAAVNRVGHEGPRRSGGHRVLGRHRSSPIRSASIARRGVARPRKRSLIVECDLARIEETSAATGRSCATAASTPTARSRSRFIDE